MSRGLAGRPRIYKTREDNSIKKIKNVIKGNEFIYYVNISNDKQNNKVDKLHDDKNDIIKPLLFQFANYSWIVSTKKNDKNTIQKKFSYCKPTNRNEFRKRAPNKRSCKRSERIPLEHCVYIKFMNSRYNFPKSIKELNDKFDIKNVDKKYKTNNSKSKIFSKISSIIKQGNIVTLRIIYEILKSLPESIEIIKEYIKKYGSKNIDPRLNKSLLFDYIDINIKNGENWCVNTLVELGVNEDKMKEIINLYKKENNINTDDNLINSNKNMFFVNKNGQKKKLKLIIGNIDKNDDIIDGKTISLKTILKDK